MQPRLTRRQTLWIVAVVGSCLGPYLVAGVRTEQVVLYSAAAYFVFSWFVSRRTTLSLNTAGQCVVLALAMLLGVGLWATLQNPLAAYPAPRSIYAGVDNLLLPLAAIAVAIGVSPNKLQTIGALRVVYRVLLLGVVVNLGIQLLQLSGEELDLGAWWSTADGSATAQRAGLGGRFTGLFNQPYESGLFYGSVLVLWFCVGSKRLMTAIPALGAILAGGFISSSKVFFAALAIVAVVAFLRVLTSIRSAVVLLASAGFGVAVLALISGHFEVSFIERYLDQGELISNVTGGRLGVDGASLGWTTEMLDLSPTIGFGMQGYPTPYDSAWLEWLSVAGLVGVTLGVCVLLAVVGAAFVEQSTTRPLGRMMAALCVAAALGGPVLTANRAAIPLWLVLTWSLLTRAATPTPIPPAASRQVIAIPT